MDFESAVLFYVVLLISLVFHEAAHALFALLGGDRTAYVGGQVTLNPIPHIRREPFGTVVLPVVLLVLSKGTMCIGFASTPIDAAWAHRHPKRAALMSAAGPLSNLLLAAIAFGVLKYLVVADLAFPAPASGSSLRITPHEPTGAIYAIASIASVFWFLNVVLAVLNLIPWPPLDGAGVVGGLVTPAERFYAFVRSQPLLLVLGIIVIWRFLPSLFAPVLRTAERWL